MGWERGKQREGVGRNDFNDFHIQSCYCEETSRCWVVVVMAVAPVTDLNGRGGSEYDSKERKEESWEVK